MKTLKIATIATAITLALIALCGIATATAETADTYALTAVVTSWEKIGDTDLCIINCTTKDGNVWSFFDDEEYYRIGDVVVLTMWDVTAPEEEDEVIDVIRVDHLDTNALIWWLN